MVGVLTDGDIRRALLKNYSLQDKCQDVCNKEPKTINSDSKRAELINLLENYKFIPYLDDDNNLLEIVTDLKNLKIPIAEPNLTKLELNYLMESFNSGWISSQGKFIGKFEKAFAKYIGSDDAITTSSGTTALHLALETLGVKENDEVIVPNLTFAASINSIIYTGAKPIIIDVNKDNLCMDIEQINKRITERTKCILVVHLYGYPCPIDEILDLAKAKNILVVEDCAEALGTYYRQSHVGTKSDASTFSFFANKLISTGEGGMVVFKEKNNCDKARILRDHGMDKNKRYWHNHIGFNYRMTNLQASIGLAQIERILILLKNKTNIKKKYNQIFANHCELLQMPPEPKNGLSSNWLYTVKINFDVNIELLIKLMRNKGIDVRRVFIPLSEMPIYKKYAVMEKDFYENSYLNYEKCVSLPSSTLLNDKEIIDISEIFLDVIQDIK